MGLKGVFSKHLCLTCGETDATMFFGKQKTRCKSCQSKLNESNRVSRRNEAVMYKGGKCEHCGYDRYVGALEFHHMDPSEKDPMSFKPTVAKKKFFAEVDKCVLLCANCHREEHARIAGRL